MTTLKSIFLAFVLSLSFSSFALSSTSALALSKTGIEKIDYDTYEYIDNILYHIFYDDKGNVLSIQKVVE